MPVATGYSRRCPWIYCTAPPLSLSKAMATNAWSYAKDSRGIYQCSKYDDHWMNLYLLAAYEGRCTGDQRQRRFDGILKAIIPSSSVLPFSMTTVARTSSTAPRSWYHDQEFIADGILLFADAILASYHEHTSSNAPGANFIPL
jgi:hypothetical protein